MTNRVHIGALIFDAEGTNGWIYNDLQGWRGSPAMRDDSEELPNADGASEVDKNYRSPRVITFQGGLVGPTLQSAEEDFYDHWAALQADGVPFLFSVERDWGTRSCVVSLLGEADVTAVADGLVAGVTAQFIAYDPIKYGPSRALSTGLPTSGGGLEYNLFSGGAGGAMYYGANGVLGRVTMTNSGTAAVWPSVTITGGLTLGFFAQRLDTGQVVRYDHEVPAGGTVSINFRTGEVLIDGVSDGSTYLTRYEFWSVAPGASFEVQFNAIGGSSGTPTATWAISDGYW